MVATLFQIGWAKWHHGKVDGMLIASGIIIVFFGGATLLLHNESFIKWKPSILYWLFAFALVFSDLFLGKNLIQKMMQNQLELPALIWKNLNAAWAGFFVLLGAVNLYVAFHYSTDTWVNFKLFGVTGFMLAFVIAQGLLLSKYLENTKDH